MPQTLLEITGLHQYRGFRHVLRGLDLTVGRSEIVGLVGRNGSGKSTLIKTVGGQLPPREGTMLLDGASYAPQSPAQAREAGVSVIEQDFAVAPEVLVVENMLRHTALAQAPRQEQLMRGVQVLSRTGFDLDLERPLGDLDPAGQALAEVLRVQAEGARLVIFDEVSAVLDDLEISQLHAAARLLRDQGCSILHIAHRLEEVTALSDRVAVIRDGVVVEVVDADRAEADDLVRAMLERSLPEREQAQRPAGREVLTVHGLAVDGLHDPVDLTLHGGQVLGVVGLRTSGARELVLAIAGQAAARAGGRVAHVAGRSDDELEARQSDVLTASLEGLDEHERLQAAFVRAIEFEMETSNLHAPVRNLSGGDQQKASIASIAETSADVVVLEHPTRGVDVGARARAYDVVDALVARDRAVVVLTSDLSEVLSMCDRVAVVHEHRLVAVLDTADVDEDVVMDYALTGASTPRRVSREGGRRSAPRH